MHDAAKYGLWIPIKWINNQLGNGFLAGLATVILMFILIPTAAFMLTKFVSVKLRFLHNLVLFVMLGIVTILFYYNLYYSFFDPSSLNWNNWHNETAHILFAGIIVVFGFSILGKQIQDIEESRCPDCKYWDGYAYNRKLMFRDVERLKKWNEESRGNVVVGISNERYETHFKEGWKDSCKCIRCGHKWTLSRLVRGVNVTKI